MKRALTVKPLLLLGLVMLFGVSVLPINANAIDEGTSENGILQQSWTHQLYENSGYYGWGYFGSSPAIADFGSDVGDGDAKLEIFTGSDAYYYYESDIGTNVLGAWHMFKHDGTTIWAKNTQSDEARGDAAIIDLNGNNYLEIVTGTTSGETIEVMDRHGNFVWTFPNPPQSGGFIWPGGPAVADVDPGISGLEVIAGNRPENKIYAFDGDNSDGVDDGMTVSGWNGTEGTDWDVLWTFELEPYGYGEIYATPAIGDIDNDGTKEVVVGSTNGTLVALNAATGALEWTFAPGGAIYSSAALADYDGDGDLELVVGIGLHVYFIDGDEDSSGTIDSGEYTSYAMGGAVYSSASIGDVDNDGDLETLIGCNDGNLTSLDYDLATNNVSLNWQTPLGGVLYSSPSLANRNNCAPYRIEWAMFRNNPQRTGFYGSTSGELDVYIGSTNGYLYLVDGNQGTILDKFYVGTFIWFGNEQPNEIRTSPSIADVDGDGLLEVFFYEWGSEDTFWAVKDLESCQEAIIAAVTYDGDTLVSTGAALTANVNLVGTLRDGDGNVLDITGEEVTFELSAEGIGTLPLITTSSSAGVATATTALEPAIYLVVVNVPNANISTTAILVVYNNDGGFATGGGWIVPNGDWEEGANSNPGERANFGFNAKYKNGDPTGHIEFRYSDGSIDLKSYQIDMLVITGGQIAQFRGMASVNGVDEYSFFVKAIDNGEPGTDDVFEIKIWNPGDDPEVDEPHRAGGVLSGGNIKVHLKN